MAGRATKFTAIVAVVAMMSFVQGAVSASPSGAVVTPVCTSLPNLATCVTGLLNANSDGMYLKQEGGKVLASANADFAYEPASSIKVLIAYYAFEQVKAGKALLSDQIPMISTAGGPGDCPPATITGSESIRDAIKNMLRNSDNNRTRELMQHFGVDNLNAFAVSLKLTNTHFQTSASPPGFNVVGCLSYPDPPLPNTVDGNTMSLTDASTLWTDVDKLPAALRETFFEVAAGREMLNSQGFDFTGYWPTMQSLAQALAPAGMSAAQVESFISHMTVSVKGGSYEITDGNPGFPQWASWFIFAGIATIPSCAKTKVKETKYTWGYFVSDHISIGSPDASGFNAASGQILAPLIARGIANWAQCAPTVVAAPAITTPKPLTLKNGADIVPKTVLAKFTDPDKTDIAADIEATINWGDGSSSPDGTVYGKNGHFKVGGSHRYAGPGIYTAFITVHDVGSGDSATAPVTITVK
jgi:hypothetical protein